MKTERIGEISMFKILKIKLYRHGLGHHKPIYDYSISKMKHTPYYICHLDQYELDILMKALKAESENTDESTKQ